MSVLFFVLVLLCLVMYVVLDGYDLGIGVATLLERDEGHRRAMLEQVAQAWDANETWIVLLVVTLWAGFPLAFGTILPHAYLPLIVMLFALIVRGVSVEIASHALPAPRWERAFGIGSLVAALMQGIVLSTLAANLTVTGGAYSGSPFGSLGWFSVLTAVTVTCVYLALGYAYTKWKATGELRARAGRRGIACAAAAAVLSAACLAGLNGTAAPLQIHGPAAAIGFGGLLLFAAAGGAMAIVELRPASRYDFLPLVGLATFTVALLVAVVVARYPVLVPPNLTVAAAVAPVNTIEFLAVMIGLQVPLLLFYNWFAHHAFSGRLSLAPDGREETAQGGPSAELRTVAVRPEGPTTGEGADDEH